MVEYVPDEEVSSRGEGTICQEILDNNYGDIEEMLYQQDRHEVEVWRLFLEIGDGFRPTQMKHGVEAEVDDEKVVDEIKDLNVPGVESVSSVHTHPAGRFLSPGDIQMHIDTMHKVNGYEATLAVATRTGMIEMFGVTGGENLKKSTRDKASKRLEMYWDNMEDSEDLHELYGIAKDMFEEMDAILDFCRASTRVPHPSHDE